MIGANLERFGDRTSAVKAVQEGVPVEVYTTLRERLGQTDKVLTKVLGLPERTLLRRKHEGRFKPDESEKIVRFVRLFELAKEVLEGPENASRWLQQPNLALGLKTPFEYAGTELGAQEVEDLLYRIEYTLLS